ncbi:Peroxin 13, N-terminal region-domain-containing protein [Suillus paluster]|uniref:Peroxin 13, N-terminal region-domain-containing protein n=1 Tax=Suillus paluster TaxID=48578 RepID=UPI001B86602A|nr:Peroxin 13, N-terminal region-domain-containing protein [Suillus paluster]KAG1739878.1 Peroxin 13, N-terminal region-domain-containing protein [Suillus paluster]
MASPPKPWERGAAAAAPAATIPTTLPSATTSSSSPEPPSVPARPPVFSNPSTSIASPYNSLQSSYNTPYSPYSHLGSSYYLPIWLDAYGTGYGGYGMNSMYGGMPGMGGMGGMGSMGGMGMYPGMDPNNPSLTQTLETTTQHTFSLLHSIVQTFSGVAQMIESTFMATHSSFFAMVGVIEQFSHLRNALGSVLSLFGLLRWMKELITGRQSSTSSIQGEFREFVNGKPVQGPMGPPAVKPSRKPIIIFLLAIFGVPYAMTKLIKILNERTMQQQQAQIGPGPLGLLDPSTLTFARALYPFTPSSPSELALRENEIVAIMGKLDPSTGVEVDPRLEVESEWWKGRTREGREGWFPKKWVEVLERRKPAEESKKVV